MNYMTLSIEIFQDVSKPDQLFPFYVMRIAQNIPGLTGLALAGITSASLR